jgi:hypothetical protein
MLDQRLDQFVDYFENTYIGQPTGRRGIRMDPLFEINRWNARTLNGTSRTNNHMT